jgi:hypothetical protein
MKITESQLRKIIREELIKEMTPPADYYIPPQGAPQPAPLAVGLVRNLLDYYEANEPKTETELSSLKKKLYLRAYAMAPKGDFDDAWIEEFKQQLSGRLSRTSLRNEPLGLYVVNMCVRRAIEKISGSLNIGSPGVD